MHFTRCTKQRKWILYLAWSTLVSSEILFYGLKATLRQPFMQIITEGKTKMPFRKPAMCSSLFSPVPLWQWKTDVLFVSSGNNVTIASSAKAPVLSAFREVPCKHWLSVTPLLPRVLWFGLGSCAVRFPCGGSACFSSYLWICSFPNSQEGEAKESLFNLWSPKYS